MRRKHFTDLLGRTYEVGEIIEIEPNPVHPDIPRKPAVKYKLENILEFRRGEIEYSGALWVNINNKNDCFVEDEDGEIFDYPGEI